MNGTFASLEELTGNVKEYINTKIDTVKLTAAEKSSGIIANIIAVSIILVVFLFFMAFASIAGAYALSVWIGKPYAGFLIVSGFYLFVGIIVWLGRERLLRIPIMNDIIHQLFKNDREDEED